MITTGYLFVLAATCVLASQERQRGKNNMCLEEKSPLYNYRGKSVVAVWPESSPTLSSSPDFSLSSKEGIHETNDDNGDEKYSYKGEFEESLSESKEDLFIYSEPPCFGHNYTQVFRKCIQDNSTSQAYWEPRDPPVCANIKAESQMDSCPSPFQSIHVGKGIICLLVTPPQEWSLLCLTTGTTLSVLDLKNEQFSAIMEELGRRNLSYIWLPARRTGPYGPILRKLPGRGWNERYLKNTSWILNSWQLDEECLRLDLQPTLNVSLSTDNCSAKHHMVCVLSLEEGDAFLELSCPKGYWTSRYWKEQGRCFKIQKDKSFVTLDNALDKCNKNDHLMKISSPYVKYLILEMSDEMDLNDYDQCWVDLSINSTYFSNDGVHMLMESSNGMTIKESPLKTSIATTLPCTICEVEAPIVESEMTLSYNAKKKKLYLSVYAASGLWIESKKDDGFQCFTDSVGLISKVKVKQVWSRLWTLDNVKAFRAFNNNKTYSNLHLNVHKIIYELKYFKKRPGQYWCEGHRVSTFEQVTSNKLLVSTDKIGNVYSVILDIHSKCSYNITSCDSTFISNIEYMEKHISQILPRKVISDIRVMKVINITRNDTLRLAVHITPKLKLANITRDYVRMYNIIRKSISLNVSNMQNTQGCIPSRINNGLGWFQWNYTHLGATSIPQELCIGDTGLPLLRSCLGNFTLGGYWGPVSGNCSKENVPSITVLLHELATNHTGNVKPKDTIIAQNVSFLTSRPKHLSPADIYYTACVMRNLAYSSAFNKTLTKQNAMIQLVAISQIFNHITQADQNNVVLAQKHLNSSNMLLDAVDVLFDQITSNLNDTDNDGILLLTTPYVIVQITDPMKTNVTGLALLHKEISHTTGTVSNHKDFTHYDIVSLTSDQSLQTVLEIHHLEAAVWVPQQLVNIVTNITVNETWYDNQSGNKKEHSNLAAFVKPRIVITLFYKDLTFQNNSDNQRTDSSNSEATNKMFNDSQNHEVHKVGSRIVSVTIPGFGRELPVPIPIIFRPLLNISETNNTNPKQCTFWDFAYNSSTPSSSLGGWSKDGCIYAGHSNTNEESTLLNEQLDVCICTHLTHFAELIVGRYELLPSHTVMESEYHQKTLDIITMIGCTLSLFGIAGIATTAVMFRSWRQKPGTKVLLQLSLALAMQMILILLSDMVQNKTSFAEDDSLNHCEHLEYECNDSGITSTDVSCITLGACIHYFSLAVFTWMLITAVLQFLRYVRVLGPMRPPRFLFKAMLFGWGVPLIPVILVLSITPTSYLLNTDVSSLCYPSGFPLYFGLLIPILLILVTNLVVFILVINSILRGPDGKLRSNSDTKLVISQLRLSVLLFFLLGLSWMFALLVAFRAGLIFSYLFCMTATMQGFVMFLFFVACDPTTRRLWGRLLGPVERIVWKIGISESSLDLTHSSMSTEREFTSDIN